jgi:crotonobetainyl-CoA:carnitine CoA-transferase CaiB-like acyl-CoA transferase
MASWPVRVDGKPPTLKPSPLLGQHSEDVLHDWLGIDAKGIAALREEGVL